MSHGLVRLLAKGKDWVGESAKRDKDVVKQCGARWCPDVAIGAKRGAWVAPTQEVMLKLIKTRLWKPVGVESAQNLIDVLQTRVDAAKKEDAQREALERAEEFERVSRRLRMAEEAAADKEADKDRSKSAFARRELGVLDSSDADLKELQETWRVDAAMVEASGTLPFLGPRSGMSDAQRVRRAFAIGGVEGFGVEGMPHKEIRKKLRNAARKRAA